MAKIQALYSTQCFILFTLISQIVGLKLVRGDWDVGLCQNTKRDSAIVGGQYDTVLDSLNPFQNGSDCTLNGCPGVSNDECLDWCRSVPSVQACEQRSVGAVTWCYSILSPVSSTNGDAGPNNNDECYIIESHLSKSSTTPLPTTMEKSDDGGITGFRLPFVVPAFVFIAITVVLLRGRRNRAQRIEAMMNNVDPNTVPQPQGQRHSTIQLEPMIVIPPPYISGDTDEQPPAYDELRKLVDQDRVVDHPPPPQISISV
eukprot:m.81632 g.81632  ORF g.81632 m.81632 type:complete len:258 (-) comp25437_c0_seq3:278-1051(-)